jgi:acetyl-CoA decarbonylase/synthase complex subunit delta
MERNKENHTGIISQIELGSRRKVTCGGHSSMPFLSGSYQRPLLALEVHDVIPPDLNPFLQRVWPERDTIERVKKAESLSPDLVCLRFIASDPDLNIRTAEESADLLKGMGGETSIPLIITGCGNPNSDEELLPLLGEAVGGAEALLGIATDKNYRMLTVSCLANGHALIAETPLDINMAKQLNILICDLGFPVDRIVMHHVTGALGYGLEYCYSIMEKCRLAALEGDKMLSPVMMNFVGKETWKIKEAQESEDLGINWEVATSIAYLEAGADILVLSHPESLTRLTNILDALCPQ